MTWQLPVGDLLDPPIPGDVVVDEAGVGSTIRAVIRLRGSSRYTCSARRTELNSATAERFDVDRPVYVTTSEGLAIDRWERVRVAAEGHFAQVLADTSARHLLTILCEIPIEAGDRVHRHRGGVYRVESLSERADAGDPAVITIIDEAAYDALAS